MRRAHAARDQITVIIPTRNRPAMLVQAVDSVRRQTVGAPQIIVADDGSEPPVGPLPDVRVLRLRPSGGAARARNHALAAVQTDLVAFLDDDDVWAPDKLRVQRDALAARPEAQWSYTGAWVVDDDLTVLGAQRARFDGWIEPSLLRGNVVAGGGSSVIARTDFVRARGGFDEDLTAAEDWELWVRLARESQVAAVDRPLAAWREHPANKSQAWSSPEVSRVEAVIGARCRDLGLPFEHSHRVQLDIDRRVAVGDRRGGARAYAERFRSHRRPKDVVAALGMLLAPRSFAAAKRWVRRRQVPSSWWQDAYWVAAMCEEWSDAATRLQRYDD